MSFISLCFLGHLLICMLKKTNCQSVGLSYLKWDRCESTLASLNLLLSVIEASTCNIIFNVLCVSLGSCPDVQWLILPKQTVHNLPLRLSTWVLDMTSRGRCFMPQWVLCLCNVPLWYSPLLNTCITADLACQPAQTVMTVHAALWLSLMTVVEAALPEHLHYLTIVYLTSVEMIDIFRNGIWIFTRK